MRPGNMWPRNKLPGYMLLGNTLKKATQFVATTKMLQAENE